MYCIIPVVNVQISLNKVETRGCMKSALVLFLQLISQGFRYIVLIPNFSLLSFLLSSLLVMILVNRFHKSLTLDGKSQLYDLSSMIKLMNHGYSLLRLEVFSCFRNRTLSHFIPSIFLPGYFGSHSG